MSVFSNESTSSFEFNLVNIVNIIIIKRILISKASEITIFLRDLSIGN